MHNSENDKDKLIVNVIWWMFFFLGLATLVVAVSCLICDVIDLARSFYG